MSKRHKSHKETQENETASTTDEADPVFIEILKGLLANPNIYTGRADQDGGVIKTAIRLRKALSEDASI